MRDPFSQPAGVMTATRRALYELARWIPMQRLAPLLGLSDSGLGQIYRQHWIDRASRGDWARQQHGLMVSRPPFRLAPAEAGEVAHFGSAARPRLGRRDRRDHALIALLERDANADAVVIPDFIHNAHPLVRRGAKASDRQQYLGQGMWPCRIHRPTQRGPLAFLTQQY